MFGQALTSVQVQKKNVITCTYNGSTWDVDVQTFNTESGFIENSQLGANIVQSSNIANGAISATQIANGSVTLVKLASNSVDSSKIVDGTIVTADLADNSVTTAKIVDANITTAKIADANITTVKIADSNVTTAKIADGDVTAIKLDSNSVTTVKILDANVTTAKLADDSVTNAKLNTMTASSIKIGDSSGNPQDLPIGLDEIPIGNGTTVTTINKNDILPSLLEVITVPISFELNEQCDNIIVLPFDGTLISYYFSVTKDLAGTDDAQILFKFNVIPYATVASLTVPLSSSTNTVFLNTFSSGHEFLGGTGFIFSASKTTPGGKGLMSFIVQRI